MAKISNYVNHTSLNNTVASVLPFNNKRKAIIILFGSGTATMFAFGRDPSATVGFQISSAGQLQDTLTVENFGPGLCEELRSFGIAGSGTFMVMEGFDD